MSNKCNKECNPFKRYQTAVEQMNENNEKLKFLIKELENRIEFIEALVKGRGK